VIINVLQAIFAFILVLAPLVFIHELGHFLAAKALRIGVPVFSLGFGPRLFGFRRAETDYRVSLVPLGGYVRLAGDEADEQRTGAPEEFLSRPKWQRFIVFVAGAAFNVVLAFLAMWLLFGIYGKDDVSAYPVVLQVEPDSPAMAAGIAPGDKLVAIEGQDLKGEEFLNIYSLQITLAPNADKRLLVEREGEPVELLLNTGENEKYGIGEPGWFLSLGGKEPAVIQTVIPGDRADKAGLRSGDEILAAGGREPISEIELRVMLRAAAEQEILFKVLRDGEVVELIVTPRDNDGRGFIGVDFRAPDLPRRSLSVGEAAAEALRTNISHSKTLFVVLKRLVTREVSLRTMSGPIGIAQVARQALVAGPETFLYLLGFFSLQLGILNLLPIPVLDGGHILILGVESVMRRELSERVKERVMQAGFVFLLAFMGVIIYLDVVKSF
jgi:regulator of sigma E protease